MIMHIRVIEMTVDNSSVRAIQWLVHDLELNVTIIEECWYAYINTIYCVCMRQFRN
jgi:hypothetical protein